MLDSALTKKICDFIYQKPRSIKEVADHIEKNWRTCDSYIDRIQREQGVLGVRTFREGTRGALKIVFWNNVEKIHSSDFQEKLFNKIESGKDKEDFSPFDIYQYVDEDKRSAFLEEQSEYTLTNKQNLVGAMQQAERQILIFSGNLSWVNAMQGKKKIIDVFEELAKKNISIKIICQVDIDSIAKIERILEINQYLGKNNIEVRHSKQPLRAFIVDNKFARFKEIKQSGKGSKNKYLFYDILEEEWISWIEKVFWNIFRTSIKAEKRIADMKTIERIR